MECPHRALLHTAITLVALAATAGAMAQSRAFPQSALRGTMAFGNDSLIAIDGRVATLTPGSRVRDQDNRIVPASSLAGGKALVNYTVELGGAQVRDVWILRPDEAAVRPWPQTTEEASTWQYDPASGRWLRP